MQFTCESCRTVLQIADEKVRGKRLIVRCKRCGAKITISDPALGSLPRTLVPGQPPAPAAPARPAAAAPAPAPAAGGPDGDTESTRAMDSDQLERALEASKREEGPRARAATTPAPPAATAPAPAQASPVAAPVDTPAPYARDAPIWFAMVSGRQTGPMTRSELALRTAQGAINARTYLWREGMDAWQRAKDVAEFGALFGEAAPGETARLPSAAPAGAAAPPAAAEKPRDALDLARWASAELGQRAPSGETPRVSPARDAAPERYQALFSGTAATSRRSGPMAVAAVVVLAVVCAAVYWLVRVDSRRSAARAAVAAQEAAEAAAAAAALLDAGPSAAAKPDGGAEDAGPGRAASGPRADQIRRRLDETQPAYQSCIAEALRRDSSLRRVGRIHIATTVAPSGAVAGAKIDRPAIDEGPLGACLKRVTRGIRFDAFAGEATEVDIPLVVSGEK